jgi:DNA-binding CsgD family transcriptional regulator
MLLLRSVPVGDGIEQFSAISGDFVRATEWRRVREFATDAAVRVAPTALVVEGDRVADQIAGGATYREAAAELFVSVRTVETHAASIHRKLGVRTRSELRRALSE